MAEIGAEEDVLKIRNPLTKLIITKAIHKAIKNKFGINALISIKDLDITTHPDGSALIDIQASANLAPGTLNIIAAMIKDDTGDTALKGLKNA